MKITTTDHGRYWDADILELPGSPPVGLGPTKEAAIIDLLYMLLRESEVWKKHITDISTLET